MTREKQRRKARPNRMTGKGHRPWGRVLLGMAALIILVVAAGFLVRYLLSPEKKPFPPTRPPVEKPATPRIPPVEIYPREEPPPPPKKEPFPPAKLPELAIIIDDIGYDREMAEKMMSLDPKLTISVLPFSPFQKQIVRSALGKGIEILLHLPMEPVEYPKVDPGPGALLAAMTPDRLIDQLHKNLDSLPEVKGVNNHMGSRMTADSDRMNQVFTVLKKRGLFFIDSRTTGESVCKPSARLFQVPFAQRDTFLDHDPQKEAIRRQIENLIRIASSRGAAIGIGHPHPSTYQVLKEMIPGLKNKVHLVSASALVRRVEPAE